jgi:hypothetical protein
MRSHYSRSCRKSPKQDLSRKPCECHSPKHHESRPTSASFGSAVGFFNGLQSRYAVTSVSMMPPVRLAFAELCS